MRIIRCIPLVLCLLACTRSGPDSSGKLHDLFDEEWEFRLREHPLFATSTGDDRYNDRLPSVTAEDVERRAQFAKDLLERLQDIDPQSLGRSERVDYDIFKLILRDRVESAAFPDEMIPINADSGFHSGLARLPKNVPLRSLQDYDDYLARLRAIPKYFQQQIAMMREGLKTGFTQPRVVLEGYETSVQAHVVADAEKSVFWEPFEKFPNAVPEKEWDRLRKEGKKAVLEDVSPSYASFLDFLVNEYRPGARTTLGASELPNGRAYYDHLVRHFTTLPLTAEEVHQTGLDEVARIRGEMEQVIRDVGFKGGFADFLHFLRTDPRFYAKTPLELLQRACYIAKQMDGKLPSLFKTLPRLPYGVEPVPDSIAPKYTGGRYVGAPVGGTRAGTYWVNTYDLKSRPLYTQESLTLHEAVPGHHLQNALRQELEGLPSFRRFTSFSAFGEGWGLYSERLGLEAGFYADPYSNFGRLTYEMWRACRLVVDTGLHAMGWTRQQTIDFMAQNTALSLHEITTETDRYISWPGQALAYKIGELKIRALRRKAEEALGEKFDLREFHDAVLLNGSIPLPVLESEIDEFIRRSKGE